WRHPAVPAARERDVAIQHSPRHTQRHGAKTGGVEQRRTDRIERAWFAALLSRFAVRRVLVGDEQIGDEISIAAGAAQTKHLPIIDDRRLGARKQKAAD